jgi:hemin uptake protein HemP
MTAPDPKERRADPGAREPATVSSSDLVAGRKQLIIQHGREQYRLLLTSSNKLILTK